MSETLLDGKTRWFALAAAILAAVAVLMGGNAEYHRRRLVPLHARVQTVADSMARDRVLLTESILEVRGEVDSLRWQVDSLWWSVESLRRKYVK